MNEDAITVSSVRDSGVSFSLNEALDFIGIIPLQPEFYEAGEGCKFTYDCGDDDANLSFVDYVENIDLQYTANDGLIINNSDSTWNGKFCFGMNDCKAGDVFEITNYSYIEVVSSTNSYNGGWTSKFAGSESLTVTSSTESSIAFEIKGEVGQCYLDLPFSGLEIGCDYTLQFNLVGPESDYFSVSTFLSTSEEWDWIDGINFGCSENAEWAFKKLPVTALREAELGDGYIRFKPTVAGTYTISDITLTKNATDSE